MKMRSWLFSIAFAFSASCMGAGGGFDLLSAKTDINDAASLQRGASLYVNFCIGCHSLDYMRYQRMGEDLGISPEQMKDNLLFTADKVTEKMSIAMDKAMAERWFGVAPPDLSLIARSRGTDWLYSYLLTFYADPNPSRPFGVNNLVFPDVGMPHVLSQLQGTQAYEAHAVDGKVVGSHVESISATSKGIEIHKAIDVETSGGGKETHHVVDYLKVDQPGAMGVGEYRAAMRDLVNFLAYASEPGKLSRTTIGVWVLVFLAFMFALTRMLYKEYWKDIH